MDEKLEKIAKITPRQRRFVDEYLVDLNATQAAIRAGYSEKTAKEVGYKLLTYVHVNRLIGEAKAKRAQKTEWTAEEILRDIREIAEDREVQHRDRLKAFELAGRHIGMWVDRREVSGPGGGPIHVVAEISRMTDEELDDELTRLTADTTGGTGTGQGGTGTGTGQGD